MHVVCNCMLMFLCVFLQFLTLAGGESGAPRVAPNARHQRVSDQVVACIALELHSAPCVQGKFLHFAMQNLFGAATAFSNWHERGKQR